MSTATGPDLAAAKAAVERLMDDTCQIRRGRGDTQRVLNRATAEVSAPARLPYYDGPCLLTAIGSPGQDYQGGNEKVYLRYQLSIPIPDDPVDDPQPGDIALMTSSRRDPGAVGLQLRVMSIEHKTFAIKRLMECELYVAAVDRP